MNKIYNIPLKIMQDTKKTLMEFGRQDKEGFLLWKGLKLSESEFQITGFIVPKQIARKTTFGYSFEIPTQAIRDMQLQLEKTGETGLIQVHSHPGKSALHSDMDDKLCILSKKNALSIVLPYFANIDFDDFSNSKVHIQSALYIWEVLSNDQVNKILRVIR